MNVANYIGRLARIRPASIIAREIDDEIDFHIECQVDALVRRGLSEEEARRQTLARFGDRRQIARQCHRIQLAPARMIAWAAIAMVAIALSVIGWLGWSLASLRLEHANLVEQMNAALTSANPSPPAGDRVVPGLQDDSKTKTLSGKVLDMDGKPVAGAKILLIHKSWRDGYNQEDHSTESGADGEWKFENLYRTDVQNAFLVTVVADGYEMKSDYELHKPGKSPGEISFRLKPAPARTITFQDAEGQPLAETDVVLLSRKSGAKEHMLYEQNALDAKKVTDEEGKAEFSCLLQGDQAKFGIIVFGKFEYVELKIADGESPVVRLEKKTKTR